MPLVVLPVRFFPTIVGTLGMAILPSGNASLAVLDADGGKAWDDGDRGSRTVNEAAAEDGWLLLEGDIPADGSIRLASGSQSSDYPVVEIVGNLPPAERATVTDVRHRGMWTSLALARSVADESVCAAKLTVSVGRDVVERETLDCENGAWSTDVSLPFAFGAREVHLQYSGKDAWGRSFVVEDDVAVPANPVAGPAALLLAAILVLLGAGALRRARQRRRGRS